MKILVGLLGLTVGLALPLFGQEPQAVSADVRLQVEAVFVKFQDAYNARDAEGIASTMTQDMVEMRSWAGLAIGKQAVIGRFLQDFKENPGQMMNTTMQKRSSQKLPPVDNNCGDSVSDEVSECPAFAHESIDADQENLGALRACL